MELWRLKVHVRRGSLCTEHAQRAFHFDRLYLMTLYRLETGKEVQFFSVLIALSCGVNNFVQEDLFILTIFIL